MKSNDLAKVTEVIIRKRRENAFTQKEFAKALKVSPGFIGNIESFRKYYNLDHIFKIARLLKCSPKELIPELETQENNG